jgi:beta-xylosidase
MKADAKVLTRRLTPLPRGEAKSPMERFPRTNSSTFHLWLEMLRSTSLETGDSEGLENQRAIPSESLKEE